jgi:hypothetical protein
VLVLKIKKILLYFNMKNYLKDIVNLYQTITLHLDVVLYSLVPSIFFLIIKEIVQPVK